MPRIHCVYRRYHVGGARFVVDVVTAVATAVGAERVGLRISPEIDIQDTVNWCRSCKLFFLYACFSNYFFVAFSEYIRGIMSLEAGSLKR